jgi:uncharacterized membrane protein YidH (DUF202 family)
MSSPEEPPPGVARERTGLAWERQALAFCGLAAVVLGVAARHDAPGLLALTAVLLGVALAVWRAGRRSYVSADVQPQTDALRGLALVTAATALIAAIVVVVRF